MNPITLYGMMSDQRDYEQTGVIGMPGALTHHECDLVNTIYERHADPSGAPILNLDRIESQIRVMVMKNPAIVAAVEFLYKSRMVGLQTYYFFKKPGTPYASQEWNPHQDNSYPRSEPWAYVAVEIALSDQNVSNGGLYYYPGSRYPVTSSNGNSPSLWEPG